MTPNNIAGTAVLAGIDVMALTDHNTLKNCPAFFSAAKRNGIIPIAGAEVTTSEDIHVVCLFPSLEAGMEFDLFLDSKRIKIPNRADIFGEQLITDENDEVIEDFSPQPDGTVKVLGGAQLDKMFEYFDMEEDEESESVSVGGWVLEQLGKMAEVGDTFEYKNLSVTVTDVEQRRVIEISVKVEEPKEENEEDKED